MESLKILITVSVLSACSGHPITGGQHAHQTYVFQPVYATFLWL